MEIESSYAASEPGGEVLEDEVRAEGFWVKDDALFVRDGGDCLRCVC